jgi:predicted nucleic-acid-binding Zn-ribbon protein
MIGQKHMPSMKKISNAFKQGAKAFGPGQYSIADQPITCPHCGSDTFSRGDAQLNTALRTFLDLDWSDKSATVLICVKCSQIQWFAKQPTKLSAE